MSLHEAAIGGNLDTVKSILESKVNVDEKDDAGNTALMAVARAAGTHPPLRSIMMMEFLIKTAKADTKHVYEILSDCIVKQDDPLVSNLFLLLGSPKKETPTVSPRKIERSDDLKKILNMHIPDIRKPVPYREQTSRPQTPPPTAEVLKLRAENEALRNEVDRLRDMINKMNPQEQLKTMYARLVQIEAIESELNNLTL